MSDIFAVIFLCTWFLGWIGLMYELFSDKFDYDNFVWVTIIILCPFVNFILWAIIFSKRVSRSGVKGFFGNTVLRIKKFFTDDFIGCINAIKNLIRDV